MSLRLSGTPGGDRTRETESEKPTINGVISAKPHTIHKPDCSPPDFFPSDWREKLREIARRSNFPKKVLERSRVRSAQILGETPLCEVIPAEQKEKVAPESVGPADGVEVPGPVRGEAAALMPAYAAGLVIDDVDGTSFALNIQTVKSPPISSVVIVISTEVLAGCSIQWCIQRVMYEGFAAARWFLWPSSGDVFWASDQWNLDPGGHIGNEVGEVADAVVGQDEIAVRVFFKMSLSLKFAAVFLSRGITLKLREYSKDEQTVASRISLCNLCNRPVWFVFCSALMVIFRVYMNRKSTNFQLSFWELEGTVPVAGEATPDVYVNIQEVLPLLIEAPTLRVLSSGAPSVNSTDTTMLVVTSVMCKRLASHAEEAEEDDGNARALVFHEEKLARNVQIRGRVSDEAASSARRTLEVGENSLEATSHGTAGKLTGSQDATRQEQ